MVLGYCSSESQVIASETISSAAMDAKKKDNKKCQYGIIQTMSGLSTQGPYR